MYCKTSLSAEIQWKWLPVLVVGIITSTLVLWVWTVLNNDTLQTWQNLTQHFTNMMRHLCLYVYLLNPHQGKGISSYAGQNGAAGMSLEKCLDQAVKDIPKEKHQNTPVYLGATAGMRLLKWVTVCVCVTRLQTLSLFWLSAPLSC